MLDAGSPWRAVALVLDQITKALVLGFFGSLAAPSIVSGRSPFFDLVLTCNPLASALASSTAPGSVR